MRGVPAWIIIISIIIVIICVSPKSSTNRVLGEALIIIIIKQIKIISAGTPLVSNSSHFSWNPKYIEFWDQYILFSS